MCGVQLGLDTVSKFLKGLNFKRLKTGAVPKKADPAIQKVFEENELQSRLQEAKEGRRKVFFVDAAHLLWGSFLGYLWCRVRHFVSGAHGRDRFNILGALEVQSHEFHYVSNDSYVDRWSVVDLIIKIAKEKYPTPVTIILDNAAYQHASVVKWIAEYYQIELLYLPSYSANLNLIERFWKFLRSNVLNNKDYESFECMKGGVYAFVKNLAGYKNDLKSLLYTNFQSFEGVSMIHR